jgi:predicted transcriptional regulator
MTTLAIELSEKEHRALESLAKDTGKSAQTIVKEALEEVLRDASTFDWKAAIGRGEGLWENRDDLPDFEQLRKEWDRDPWGTE